MPSPYRSPSNRSWGEDRNARVVAMVNTLEVSRLAVSLPLVELADAAGYETAVEPVRAEFAEDGRLVRIGSLEFFAE